jgi:hypothetical protein
MLTIAVVFLLFANIVNHSKRIHTDVKTAFLMLVYISLILIFSFPGSENPDMNSYKMIYYSDIMKSNFDYLFSLLSNTAKSFGISFNGFLFLIELLLFSIWFIASKKLFSDVHLAFMAFLPFMGIYYFGIIIRACIGMCLCYYALSYLICNKTLRGFIVYYSIVTLSVFFHASMIIFYAFPLYVFRKQNSIFHFTIILIAILIPLFNIQHYIANILESYIKLFPSSHRFLSYTRVHAHFNIHAIYSLTMIKYFIMSFIFILLRPKITSKVEIYNCFLNIYLTGALLIGLTYFITAGNRLSYIFFFFEFALVAMLYEYSTIPKKLVLLGALILCLINFANIASAVPGVLAF